MESLALKSMVYDHSNSTRLRKRKTPILGGSTQGFVCTRTQGEKVINLYDTEPDLPISIRQPLERQTIPYCEDEDIGGGNSWKYSAT